MKIPKISVLGAGNVGGSTAAALAHRRLGEVWLYDVVEGLAEGKAMDIDHAAAHFHCMPPVSGTSRLSSLAGSDIFVITAGSPRKAGMTRADLLNENLAVVHGLCEALLPESPQARVLLVTNPVDLLTGCLNRAWPDRRIFGLGCSLDTVRFQYFLARAADVSVDSVYALVIGTHDDNMIPLISHASIGGARLQQVLPAEVIHQVVRDTRQAGADIVARLKTRGSFYAASWCAAQIVEAILRDTRDVFPLSVPCPEQLGHGGLTLALPCAVGLEGVQRVVTMELDGREREALDRCAAALEEKLAAVQMSDLCRRVN